MFFPCACILQGCWAGKGHTEGSVDLARLAGLKSAAVLCELMRDDGEMMRGDDIDAFADLHGFPKLTIAELLQFRTMTHT
ncbi:MAG: 3,4-dihydroxy-2-butanone-4-phosphate synthase [Sulfuriferula sp.]|nr:3,4-dihydroxy-2-butanone-4-phosphate synthase [Sulfuriferula sp.]